MRNGAPLYTCDAPDTYARDRVEVERVGIAAAIDGVLAAAIVGIGIWDVARRDAVGASQIRVTATLENSGGRVEVDRRSVGAPVDGESAAAVIRVRSRPIVGCLGVGAPRNGIDTLRKA